MTLRDTDSLIVETGADLTPSLPDPTTVNGRTHLLVNTGTASAVWSSVGATPFTVDGVNVASMTVIAGRARAAHSDGVHWVVAPDVSRRIYAGSAVSDGSGNAVFTFSPAFAGVPDVAHALQTANANATEARVTALTASSCTVNARQSPSVTILGFSVLQTPQALTGATVHLLAIEPGQGV